MERRDFIRTLECMAAGVACAGVSGLIAGCSGLRYVASTREGGRLVVRRIDVGDEAHVMIDDPEQSRAVYLHRWDDGTFSAVSTRCTHRGCQVEPAGDRLACPCHGSEFDLKGALLRGPAERPLHRFPVTTDSEHIYIQV